MSAEKRCLRCGREGHTSSSCSRAFPPAPHTAEPWDGTDRDMVLCNDCTEAFVQTWNGRGCASYVPSMQFTPQRCHRFRPKVRAPQSATKRETGQWSA